MQSADRAILAATDQGDLGSLDGNGDILGKLPVELALGALDSDLVAVGDGDLDFVREIDGCFTDTGHGRKGGYQT